MTLSGAARLKPNHSAPYLSKGRLWSRVRLLPEPWPQPQGQPSIAHSTGDIPLSVRSCPLPESTRIRPAISATSTASAGSRATFVVYDCKSTTVPVENGRRLLSVAATVSVSALKGRAPLERFQGLTDDTTTLRSVFRVVRVQGCCGLIRSRRNLRQAQ